MMGSVRFSTNKKIFIRFRLQAASAVSTKVIRRGLPEIGIRVGLDDQLGIPDIDEPV